MAQFWGVHWWGTGVFEAGLTVGTTKVKRLFLAIRFKWIIGTSCTNWLKWVEFQAGAKKSASQLRFRQSQLPQTSGGCNFNLEKLKNCSHLSKTSTSDSAGKWWDLWRCWVDGCWINIAMKYHRALRLGVIWRYTFLHMCNASGLVDVGMKAKIG